LCIIPMPGSGRNRDPSPASNEHEPDSVSKASAILYLLNCHDRCQSSHPQNAHHTDRKHHQHHSPTAAQTIKSLPDAKKEYAGGSRCPVCEKEREWMLTAREARVLE